MLRATRTLPCPKLWHRNAQVSCIRLPYLRHVREVSNLSQIAAARANDAQASSPPFSIDAEKDSVRPPIRFDPIWSSGLRDNSEEDAGTMTLREKEILSRILLGLHQKQPLSTDQSQDTIAFDGQDQLDSESNKYMVESIQPEELAEYPAALQKQIVDAQILVKNKIDREAALRGRHSETYIKHKDSLYAQTDLITLLNHVEDVIFGPFIKSELILDKPTAEMLQFCRAYPLLLADTMCILRLSFRDYSASEAIFQKMKRINMLSRALGGSAVVYNEALLTRFEGWHDLGMVEDILLEMERDAIQADEHTLTILKYIRAQIVKEKETNEVWDAYWRITRFSRLETFSKRVVQVEWALQAQDG